MPDQAVVTAGVMEPSLEQALELVAIEHEQRRLLHHPETPEADSVTELLAVAMGAMEQLGGVCVELARTGGLELQISRDMAGSMDRLVTTLRDAERNHNPAHLTGRALARHLAPLLDTLQDAEQAAGWPQARGQLHDTFARVPADVIFRYAVTYQLGADRTSRLMRLHDAWAKSGRVR